MTPQDRFDRQIASLLEDIAPRRQPEYAELVRANARRSGQRPAWAAPRWWAPFDLPAVAIARRPLALALIVAALAAALLVVALAGQGPKLPPPIGPAANGVIAFDADGQIVLVDADGREQQRLATGNGTDSRPAFSPDGTLLAWWREAGDNVSLMLARKDGSDPRALLTISPPGTRFVGEAPAWAPDSRRIAISVVVVTGAQDHAEIWIVPVSGGAHAVLLPPSIFAAQYPAWSPDGSRIAFLGEPTRRAEGFLYVSNVDGSGLVRISERAGSATTGFMGRARWSVDGRQIAADYGDAAKLSRDILLLASDHLDEGTLVAGPQDEAQPAWSPAGDKAAYWRSTSRYQWRLVVRDVASGTEAEAGFDDPTFDTIGWSPDGGQLLVSRCDASTCELLRLEVANLDAEPLVVARMPPKSEEASIDRAYWSWQRLAP